MLRSLADQQFIQVCKSVNQASRLASAGASRVILHLPLLPCSNDFGFLVPRLWPWFRLRFWQLEDMGWVFWNSTQRFCQCVFLRRFQRHPRHRGRMRRPPRKCWQICVTWATNIYGHKYIGASATCVQLLGGIAACIFLLRVKHSPCAIVPVPVQMWDRWGRVLFRQRLPHCFRSSLTNSLSNGSRYFAAAPSDCASAVFSSDSKANRAIAADPGGIHVVACRFASLEQEMATGKRHRSKCGMYAIT